MKKNLSSMLMITLLGNVAPLSQTETWLQQSIHLSAPEQAGILHWELEQGKTFPVMPGKNAVLGGTRSVCMFRQNW